MKRDLKLGSNWRVLAHGDTDSTQIENSGIFDELVVDDWLHIEQMDDNIWWLRVGDARLIVTIEAEGPVTVNVERGAYGTVCGETTTSNTG